MKTDTDITNPPVSDRVREAVAISLRGCEELLPQEDWLKKLARSEASGHLLPPRIRPAMRCVKRWKFPCAGWTSCCPRTNG